MTTAFATFSCRACLAFYCVASDDLVLMISGNPAGSLTALSASSLLLILKWPLIHANARWLLLLFTSICWMHLAVVEVGRGRPHCGWRDFFLRPALIRALLIITAFRWRFAPPTLSPYRWSIDCQFSFLRRLNFPEWANFFYCHPLDYECRSAASVTSSCCVSEEKGVFAQPLFHTLFFPPLYWREL